MVSVHALIGIGEAILTVGIVALVSRVAQAWKTRENAVTLVCFVLAIVGSMLSPFASRFPDGLEWVAARLSFSEFHGFNLPVFFPHYQVSFVSNSSLGTVMAALIGVGLVSLTAFMTGYFLKKATAAA